MAEGAPCTLLRKVGSEQPLDPGTTSASRLVHLVHPACGGKKPVYSELRTALTILQPRYLTARIFRNYHLSVDVVLGDNVGHFYHRS